MNKEYSPEEYKKRKNKINSIVVDMNRENIDIYCKNNFIFGFLIPIICFIASFLYACSNEYSYYFIFFGIGLIFRIGSSISFRSKTKSLRRYKKMKEYNKRQSFLFVFIFLAVMINIFMSFYLMG